MDATARPLFYSVGGTSFMALFIWFTNYSRFGLCCVCVLRRFTRVRLFVTPWTTAHQTPLAMEFSRQEYWNGLPFPFSRDFPNPGMEPESLLSPVAAGGFFTTSATYGSSFKVVLDTSPSVFSLSLLFVQQDIPDSFWTGPASDLESARLTRAPVPFKEGGV